MTETAVAPDLKQIATKFQSEIRHLVSIAVSDSTSQTLPPVQLFKQENADRDRDVAAIRHRSLTLIAAKDDLARLQKEVNEKRNELKVAERAIEALAQQIGNAAFHTHLEGRVIDLKEVASRKELHEQVEALQREKEELGKAPIGGMTDKAKSIAQQATLSGRILLLQQKANSADKVLGKAVLQAGMEAEALSKNSAELLLKIAEARKSIGVCTEALAIAERQVVERQAKAITDLGIDANDSASLDAEHTKIADHLFEIESNRLKARWNCGEALLSLPPQQLAESLKSVAATLKKLKFERPDACKLPTIDKQLLNKELAAQVTYLYKCIGTVIHEGGFFKDKLSTELSSIDSAKGAKRNAALRGLGEATLKKCGERLDDTYPSLQEMRSQVEAIDLTIKELGGNTLIGTGGKNASVSTAATVGMVGCLAVIVLVCGGLLTSGVRAARQSKDLAGNQVAEVADAVPATVVVQAETEATGEAPEASATVPMESIKNLWGIIDSNGKLVVPCRFIQLFNPGGGNDPIPAQRTGWGYINRNGGQQIPEQFNIATSFTGDIALVQNRDEKWGFINPSGEWVIPASYDEARPFSTNGLAAVRKGDKWGFISKAGNEVVSCSYDEQRPFSTSGLAAVRKGDKWGFISKAGNEVVSCSYTEVKDFDGNRASVSKGTKIGGITKGGWGVIDEKGNEVVECKYRDISGFYSDHAIVWNKEYVFDDTDTGSWGIIDRNGAFTFPLQREMIRPFASWGDDQGISDLQNSDRPTLFWTTVRGSDRLEMRIITPTGDAFTEIPCQMRSLWEHFRGKSHFPVTLPLDMKQLVRTGVSDDSWGKVGYLDAEGKLCIPHQFWSAEPFSEGLAAVKTGASEGEGKWGFIDESGKMVIEPQFTEAKPFAEGIAAVKQDELWGYIDKSGKWIAQPRFAEATPFRGGMALVKAPETGLPNP